MVPGKTCNFTSFNQKQSKKQPKKKDIIEKTNKKPYLSNRFVSK